MDIRNLLVLVVVICGIQHISATFNLCGCKEKGIDMCNCKKGITAPRPYPITLPRIQRPLFKSICKEQVQAPEQFKPIGDTCHCGQQIVKPAPLPRPPCPHQQHAWKLNLPMPSCSCKSHSEPQKESTPSCGHVVRAPEEYQNYANDGATIYFQNAKKKATPAPKPRYAPADVVSIAIAKQLAKNARNGISEKQLQYGSMKDPIVQQKSNKNKQSNINEENFYDTKGNVLELQPYIFNQNDESSEEESSEEKKPVKKVPFRPGQLDFEAIGYQPYEPSKPRYTVVKNSQQVNHDCPHRRQNNNQHRQRQSCDCHKDLVVDQSSISEQSVSYESASSSDDVSYST